MYETLKDLKVRIQEIKTISADIVAANPEIDEVKWELKDLSKSLIENYKEIENLDNSLYNLSNGRKALNITDFFSPSKEAILLISK